jgi:hypothetical protein
MKSQRLAGLKTRPLPGCPELPPALASDFHGPGRQGVEPVDQHDYFPQTLPGGYDLEVRSVKAQKSRKMREDLRGLGGKLRA